MWKEKSKTAMTLFCNGDEDGAIASWKEALKYAAPTNNAELAEIAEINYCVGKCFADQKKDASAAFHLREAAKQFESADPRHNRLPVVQNTLAAVLQRMGKADEAVSLYQTVKGIRPTDSIDLRTAIECLHQQKLARDLNLRVIKRLCKELEIDIDGNNSDIEALLFAYYWDEKDGADRSDTDKMLITDYTNFSTESLCEYLNAIIDHPNFIAVKKNEPFKPFAAIEFVRHDGKELFKACASAVAIVDLYNEEMVECGFASLFRTLDYSPCLMAYLLTDEKFENLAGQRALNFDSD
ncbi:MAG: hypothetical protein Q8T09_10990 [Candidatus Melainabacteria bacterium]|jgi:tetratricopeptide (TPR) repeat protein|nr:hypothetical protein [Candidatus Melainabacteria bacterium]